MSSITSPYPERVYSTGEARHEHRLRARDGARGPGLMLAGLAAVGLGAVAWYYLAPDLRRYLKIRRM
jgi:hypothetical protein